LDQGVLTVSQFCEPKHGNISTGIIYGKINIKIDNFHDLDMDRHSNVRRSPRFLSHFTLMNDRMNRAHSEVTPSSRRALSAVPQTPWWQCHDQYREKSRHWALLEKMNGLGYLWLILLVLVNIGVGVSVGHAATSTQSFTFGPTAWNGNTYDANGNLLQTTNYSGGTTTSFTYNKFDPALGTLTGVDICVSVTGSGNSMADYYNWNGTADLPTLNIRNEQGIKFSVAANGNDGWLSASYQPLIDAVKAVGVQTFTTSAPSAPGSWVMSPANYAPAVVNFSQVYSGSANLNGWIGAGTHTTAMQRIMCQLATYDPVPPGGGNTTGQSAANVHWENMSSTISLQIKYTYTGSPCPSVTVTPTTLSSVKIGASYSQALSASGGTGPYTYAVTTGSLPAGLSLSGGTISGTPTGPTGSVSFTITATDANSCTGKVDLSLQIDPADCPVITVSPGSLPSGTIGAAYSQGLTASGGMAPYTFSVTSGTLPNGLSLSGATLSGTPTGPSGTVNVTITAKDVNDCPGVASFTIGVNCNALTVSPSSLSNGTVGVAYGPVNMSLTGATGAVTWEIASGALPAGVTLSASGTVSGTPTAAASASFSIRGTDANQCSGTANFSVTIDSAACPTVTVSPASLPPATLGVGYSQSISATGGTGPYTFAVSVGSLPGGLSLSGSTLSGTPTGPSGTVNFTIRATDANGCQGSVPYSMGVDCPPLVVSPSSLSPGVVGVSYGPVNFSQTGGSGAITWSVVSGSLPTGLSLNSGTGVLSGTPETGGAASFSIRATDANQCSGRVDLSLTLSCPVITMTPATLPSGTIGVAYDQLLGASGGMAPYAFSLSSGTMPNGLQINGDRLSGTPTAGGTSNFTVTVTDANGCTASRPFSVTINSASCPTVTVTPNPLPNGVVGVAYNQTPTASPAATYDWSATGLPAGLSINPVSGQITGSPTVGGSATITATASFAGSTCSGTTQLNIGCPTITVGPGSLPNGTVGVAYTQALSASGGLAPYTYSVSVGTLPNGLSLTGDTIAGTPTETGTRNFTIVAADANGCTGSASFTIGVSCNTLTLAPTTLTNWTIGSPYGPVTITQAGGVAPITWLLASGSLPTGMSFNTATAVLGGTPTSGGTSSFSIRATDSNGCSGTVNLTFSAESLTCPDITVAPPTLPGGIVGTNYSQALSASGGQVPYTYTVTGGSLPAGLSLSAGSVTGTPTAVATSNVTITATDANGCQGTSSYTIGVGCSTLTLSPSSLGGGVVGTVYGPVTFSQVGGFAPLNWVVASGALPGGLSLNASSGVLSGTPTGVGSFSFAVRATDKNGCAGTVNLTLAVTCPAITVTPAALSGGTVGTAYSETMSATGGVGPYTFAVTTGSLPGGLTLSGAGLLSGTPTAPGTFSFTITASDATAPTPCTGLIPLTLTVNAAGCPIITVAPTPLPAGIIGTAYNQTPTASGAGGAAVYTWTATGLPNGLSLNATTGAITGTPLAAGSAVITANFAGPGGTCTGSTSLEVSSCAVYPAQAATTTIPCNNPVSKQLTATGGVAPYTWSLTSGILPAGLSLSPSGLLSGTTTAIGSSLVTITTTDANACPGVVNLTINIVPGCVAVGNLVFLDSNANGKFDPGDVGINGVTVKLYKSDNTEVAVGPDGVLGTPDDALGGMVTANGGCYLFKNLQPGGYYVQIPANELAVGGDLAGKTPTTPVGTNNTTDDNGDQNGALLAGVVKSNTILLADNAEPVGEAGKDNTNATNAADDNNTNLTIDFGFINVAPPVAKLALGNLVFIDKDRSGTFNLGDVGVNGVNVRLYRADNTEVLVGPDGTLTTADDAPGGVTTANGGCYLFKCLPPGTYYVKIPASQLGAGGALSGKSVAAAPGSDKTTDDSGDHNGMLSAGDVISNSVTLADNGEPTGETGKDRTNATNTADDNNTNLTVDFAFVEPVAPVLLAIGNLVYFDANTNRVADAGEGVNGVKVVLLDGALAPVDNPTLAGTQPYEVMTANGGCYLFSGLAPGTYVVKIPASEFGVGKPLYNRISVAGTQTGDDNLGENGIDDAALALNGIKSGLVLLANGAQPTDAGDETGKDKTSDNANDAATDLTVDFGFQCAPIVLTSTPAPLPDATIGVAYPGGMINVTGATGTVTFAVTTGSLPTGLSLNLSGGISGTPTLSAASSSFTITATDAVGCRGSSTFAINVGCPAITVSPTTLPSISVGVAYSQALTATGGIAPIAWTVSTGTLPLGLSLSATGVISGTPTQSGTATFSIKATDAAGCLGTASFTVTAACPVLAVTPSTLPEARVGTLYSQLLSVAGGRAPYQFLVTSGSLPQGLVLGTTSGLINGMPTDVTSTTFLIKVTDANGCSVEVPFSLRTQKMDLALRKTLSPTQANPVRPGDLVTYFIEIFNQGTLPVKGVKLIDYAPVELEFVPTSSVNWVAGATNTATGEIVGQIAPGESAVVQIGYRMALTAPRNQTIRNTAEITEFRDILGAVLVDADSTPDSDRTNDGLVTNDQLDNVNGDQDDHDIADIRTSRPDVDDLALRKSLAANQSRSVNPGDVVAFTIEVFNQGDQPAYNIKLVDYLQPGFALADPAWQTATDAVGGFAIETTIAGPILPGLTAAVDVRLRVDPLLNPVLVRKIDNFAEIKSFTTVDGVALTDLDSVPDANPTNDGPLQDDRIANENADQDDHDIATVSINEPGRFDLALRKILDAAQPRTVNPGDPVTFCIEVYNQGTTSATNIAVTDYVPVGLVWPLNSAALNPNWVFDLAGSKATIIVPGTILPGESVKVVVTYGVSPTLNPLTTPLIKGCAEISVDHAPALSPDPDSDPDAIATNDGAVTDDALYSQNGDEDDHDCAEVRLNPPGRFDLALRETLAAEQSRTVNPGDVVSYCIEVFNQGAVTATNVQIVDYLMPGTLWPTNSGLINPGWVYNPVSNTATLVLNGPVAAGESRVAKLKLVVDPTVNPNTTSRIANCSEIEIDNHAALAADIDSTPDAIATNDGAYVNDATNNEGGDQDDADSEEVTVNPLKRFDLAIRETLDPTQVPSVNPGDPVKFCVEVFNQGSLSASVVQIVDYIPLGWNWPVNAALVNPGWSYDVATRQATTTIQGPIAPGASAVAKLTLQVDPALDRLVVTGLSTCAEIYADNHPNGNPDRDSVPDRDALNDGSTTDNAINGENGDEDDKDFASVTINGFNRYDLALRETLAPNQPDHVNPGDLVEFCIEVFNQGASGASGVEVVNYLPVGLLWPTNGAANVGWVYDAATRTARVPFTTRILSGASAKVSVWLRVDPTLNPNSVTQLTDCAEISADGHASGNPDVDSVPDAVATNDGATTDNAINGENGDEDDKDPATVYINPLSRFDLAIRETLAPTQSQNVNPGDPVEFCLEVFNQGAVSASNVTLTNYIPAGLLWPANAATVNPGWVFAPATQTASVVVVGVIPPGGSAIVKVTLQVDPALDRTTVRELVDCTEISNDNHPANNVDVDSVPDALNTNDGATVDNAINNESGDQDDKDIAKVMVNPFGRFDLAIRETLADTQSASVNPGDPVEFCIEVFNQGSVVATNVGIVNYVPTGYLWPANAAVVNPQWAYDAATRMARLVFNGSIAAGTSSVAKLTLQVDPTLFANVVRQLTDCSEIEIDHHVNGNPDADSVPDANQANDGNTVDNAINNENNDEDDKDIAVVNINPPGRFDLALRKTLGRDQGASVTPGEFVVFNIEVINQGRVPATNPQVIDYLPPGMQFVSTHPLNSGWTGSGITATATIPGLIFPGQSAVVQIALRVDPALNSLTTTSITNFAEISVDGHPTGGGGTPDADSTPDNISTNDGIPQDDAINDPTEEDDHDLATIRINPPQRFDLALRKTLTSGQSASVSPGAVVGFDVEVFNQGAIAATNVEVTDHLAAGMVWTTTGNTGWTHAPVPNTASLVIPGPIPPGGSVTSHIYLVVDPALNRNAITSLRNVAEISRDNHPTLSPDVDSTPDLLAGNDGSVTNDAINGESGDEDDHDIADLQITPFGRFDLALRKQLAQGQSRTVNPGEIVDFTIEIFNQGTITTNDVQVVDYVQTGFVWPASAALNPNWVFSSGKATCMLGSALAPDSSATLTVRLQVDPALDALVVRHLDNFAEISVDGHPTINGGTADVDSTPDMILTNDGGMTDDAINNENVDQDDHDIAGVDINRPGRFDLALRETLAATQARSVNPGDFVQYCIEVFNQGSVAARDPRIVNYLQPGTRWPINGDILNPGWSYNAGTNTATVVLGGALAPGESKVAKLSLQVEPGLNRTLVRQINNISEIALDNSATNNPDSDSVPDMLVSNDGNVVNDAINNEDGDQDDHDPEPVLINPFGRYDLAIREVLDPSQSPAVNPGDPVKFCIEVFNQGALPVAQITVVNYVPTGWNWPANAAVVNPGWIFDSASRQASVVVNGAIAPSQSATIKLTLQVDPALDRAVVTMLESCAEIAVDDAPAGNPDVDSVPDRNRLNDGATVDNAINGENGDEDDKDPAVVRINSFDRFDLAIRETLDPTQSAAVNPGDAVKFCIEIFNQGAIPASAITVVNYLPVGFKWPANSATVNTNWAYDPLTHTATVVVPGPLAPASSLKLTTTLQVDPQLDRTVIHELTDCVEIKADGHLVGNPDADSVPDAIASNDGATTDNAINSENGDEDDKDPATVRINQFDKFDLALREVLGTSQSDTVSPGDPVEFCLEIFNQGATPANNVTLVSYLPTGMVWPENSAAVNTNWAYASSRRQASIVVPGPIKPGASAIVKVILQVDPALDRNRVHELTVASEIADDNRILGNPDCDSSPDDTFGDDGAVTDNAINGENGDEDDSDIAKIKIAPFESFDLAIREVLAPAQSAFVNPGDPVEFCIEIFNQGATPAHDVRVVNYIPVGLVWPVNAGAVNPQWIFDAATRTARLVYSGIIPPGHSATAKLTLQVDPALDRNTVHELVDCSEIEVDNHVSGNPDVDSTPDANNNNDGNTLDNAINNEGNDQDDKDIAKVGINPFRRYDLALREMLAPGQSDSVNPGDPVKLCIEIFNQGAEMAPAGVVIVNYVPVGFIWPNNAATVNPGWSYDAVTRIARQTLTNPLAISSSATLKLTLTVNPGLNRNTIHELTSCAEIADDKHAVGNPDWDSTPDALATNDGAETDNAINNESLDQDDKDPATVRINPWGRFDLALRKRLGSDQAVSVNPGDDVKFVLDVLNQGSEAALDVEVTDYVPTGFVFDRLANSGWLYSPVSRQAKAIVQGVIEPAGSRSVVLILKVDPLLDRNATTQLLNIAEISEDNDPTGNGDFDSTPDTIAHNDGPVTDDAINNEGFDQDDHDTALIRINPWGRFDLALRKQLALGQAPKVNAGENVRFSLEVFNQGSIAASNVEVTDYVPVGFGMDIAQNPGWTYDSASRKATGLLRGQVLPGQSVAAVLTLRVDPTLDTTTVRRLDNFAEISRDNDPTGRCDLDSDPDANNANDGVVLDDELNSYQGDEDDHDVATVELNPPGRQDLALRKTLSSGQDYNVRPGARVCYDLEVINQGAQAMTNIRVCDYLPAGQVFEPIVNPDWVIETVDRVSCTIRGPLAPGQTQVLKLCLKIAANSPVGLARNCAEICGAVNERGLAAVDADSTFDTNPANDGQSTDNEIHGLNFDEDDHDCEAVNVLPPGTFDLALRKQPAIGQALSVNIGDRIAFTLEVFNQGQEPLKSIELIDYFPASLELDDYNWFPGTSPNTAVGFFNGTVAPGESVKINVMFRVKNDPTLAGGTIRNYAEIKAAKKADGSVFTDADSTMDDVLGNDGFLTDDEINGVNRDEDDFDIAVLTINAPGRFDLALRTTLAQGQKPCVNPGEQICYNVEIFNQGGQAARDIVFCSYIPDGLELVTPSLWTPKPGYPGVATCNIPGPIGPGLSAPFPLCLRAKANATGTLTASVEICSAKDAFGRPVVDADSVMDDNPANDGKPVDNELNGSYFDEDDHDSEVIKINPPGTYDLALRTTLATGQSPSVAANDVVCYRLEVFNQGTETVTQVKVCQYLPDGLVFDGPRNPGWAYTANPKTLVCTLPGPILPGQSQTVPVCLTVAPGTTSAINGGLGTITAIAEICEMRNTAGAVVTDPDSVPDSISDNDGRMENDEIANHNGDQDDHDGETIRIVSGQAFDLALRIGLTPGQAATFVPGDTVWLMVDLYNQGQQMGSQIKTQVTLPAGLVLDDARWVPGAGNTATYTYVGPLNAGASQTIQLKTKVAATASGPQTATAEIASARDVANALRLTDADSLFDLDPANDGFMIDDELNGLNGDADDHDIVVVALPDGASIGDLVWHDVNRNGLREANEVGLPGITVRLLNAARQPTGQTTVTGGDGSYSFTRLAPGNYAVEFDVPAGWTLALPNQGLDDNIDSDASVSTRRTATTTLVLGENDMSWDAGLHHVVATDFANWRSTTPGAGGPGDNGDGDSFNDLLEFAFGRKPNTGAPGTSGPCLVFNADGTVDLRFQRPSGLTGLTYTLEKIGTLAASPTGWSNATSAPAVTSNGDGTETVLFRDLEGLTGLTDGQGFVRMRIDSTSPIATARTETYGWLDHTIHTQNESFSYPFMKCETFSGTVTSSVSGGYDVAASAGATSVASLLNATKCYCIEVTGGLYEGHRFEVNVGTTTATTIGIIAGSPLNTMNPAPSLNGMPFVLAEHYTLGEIFPKATFQAGSSPANSDTLQTYFGGTWQTLWLWNGGAGGVRRWVKQGDINLVDQSGLCLDPCAGMFINRRGAPLTMLQGGVVRDTKFACPLIKGYNLLGSGYPVAQSPASRQLTIANGFAGSNRRNLADQIVEWGGDTVIGHQCYYTCYLVDALGGSIRRWVSVEDVSLTAKDTTTVFKPDRAAFLCTQQPHPNYVVPTQWVP
jgi:uncharacterized repeat protein (TIGR01451 family)